MSSKEAGPKDGAVRQAEWDAMKDWTLEREVGLLLDRY